MTWKQGRINNLADTFWQSAVGLLKCCHTTQFHTQLSRHFHEWDCRLMYFLFVLLISGNSYDHSLRNSTISCTGRVTQNLADWWVGFCIRDNSPYSYTNPLKVGWTMKTWTTAMKSTYPCLWEDSQKWLKCLDLLLLLRKLHLFVVPAYDSVLQDTESVFPTPSLSREEEAAGPKHRKKRAKHNTVVCYLGPLTKVTCALSHSLSGNFYVLLSARQ